MLGLLHNEKTKTKNKQTNTKTRSKNKKQTNKQTQKQETTKTKTKKLFYGQMDHPSRVVWLGLFLFFLVAKWPLKHEILKGKNMGHLYFWPKKSDFGQKTSYFTRFWQNKRKNSPNGKNESVAPFYLKKCCNFNIKGSMALKNVGWFQFLIHEIIIKRKIRQVLKKDPSNV